MAYIKRIEISVSALWLFQRCRKAWYFQYRDKSTKKMTDYARLCGQEVHRHINILEGPTKEERRFFYKTINSANGAWSERWKRALVENKSKFILLNEEMAKEYRKVGAICIANYMKDNEKLPRPLEKEKKYGTNIQTGIKLEGRIDQVRSVSIEYIKKKRPELIRHGKLIDGYDPVIIMDLKTSKYGFGIDMQDPDFMKKMRRQYELHHGLQPTTYIFLYEKVKGKKPIGFCWYHLRSNKAFFTYRTDEDYKTLFGIILDYIDSLNNNSFPKHVGNHCYWCDYVKYCQGDKPVIFSPAEDVSQANAELGWMPNIIPEKSGQLKLKIRVPRRKKND